MCLLRPCVYSLECIFHAEFNYGSEKYIEFQTFLKKKKVENVNLSSALGIGMERVKMWE